MKGNRPRVKRTRHYHSKRRHAQALLTRAAVIDAAERLFLRDGYAPTTIASIAGAAGASPETVYSIFRGKPGLVRAICKRGLAGVGRVPAEQRSDRMRMRETDPRKIIANWGRFVMEVAPRVSPILLLVRAAAASDKGMATLLLDMDRDRRKRMTINARHLFDAGHLGAGITLGEAIDVLWTFSSAELYELLVLRQGWAIKRYGRFVAKAMTAALLPP